MASREYSIGFKIAAYLSRGFGSAFENASQYVGKLRHETKKAQQQFENIKAAYKGGAINADSYYNANARLSHHLGKMKFNDASMRMARNAANFMQFKDATTMILGAADTAMKFEAGMSKVGAITQATDADLAKLTKTARELGERTQFTATQSAEAMSYLGMAGWKTNQIIEGMPGLLNLAAAGGTDLARTADIVSDNLTAFGLAAKESTHMADVYATVITNTNTNVEMLGETMKYAAPVAHAFGASMEETAAMAGLMANAGIKASQAGTSIRSGLLRLAGPPKAAATELDKLGISISDVSKEQAEAAAMLKNLGVNTGALEGGEKMIAILSQLREKFKQMGQEEKVAAGQAIFGRNAVTGWLSLLEAEDGAFEKLTKQLQNCDGAADKMAKRMMNNAQGATIRLKSAMESLSISIGGTLLPTIAEVAGKAAGMASSFSKFAADNPKLVSAITTAALAITATATAGAGLMWIFSGLRLAAIGLKGGFDLLVMALSKMKVFSTVAKVVQALNLAFITCPIGWVVAGIAALVVAGTLLYKHWDKVKTFFTNLWESPKARMLMFITGPIGWLVAAVSAIIANWDTLKAYFEYFWDNPEAALFRFQNWVQTSFQNVVDTGRKKWDALKAVLDKPIFATFIAPAWESFKNSAVSAFENVKARAGAAFDGVKATISGAVDSAVDTVMNLPGTIVKAAGYAAGYLYENLSQLPGRISNIVVRAGQFLSDLPQACLNAGIAFVNNLASWGTQAWNTATEFLTTLVDGTLDFLTRLPEICYEAGTAFLNRLTTWSSEAFGAMVAFLTNLVKTTASFLWNLPTICMDAGRKFVSAAAQWAEDAYNSIMEWIMKLPAAISNTISNAWENIKSKFSAGFTVGVSAAAQNAAPVAENAKGGIYNQGAFLTTFAEKSPEAAIPIDNSDRARGLWLRVGQMLGMTQPKRKKITPARNGYEPKPALPNITPIVNAMATAPSVLFDPVIQSAGLPDINLPDLPVQKETLIERIKEFVTSTPARTQGAPTFVVNNEFHFTGQVNEKEIRDTVDRATDITAAKFRELMQQYLREERRLSYG